MNIEMQTKIREWEAERDSNLPNSKDGLTERKKRTETRIQTTRKGAIHEK